MERAVSKAIFRIPDKTKQFVLKTDDASGNAFGAVLTQKGKSVTFVFPKLSDEGLNW